MSCMRGGGWRKAASSSTFACGAQGTRYGSAHLQLPSACSASTQSPHSSCKLLTAKTSAHLQRPKPPPLRLQRLCGLLAPLLCLGPRLLCSRQRSGCLLRLGASRIQRGVKPPLLGLQLDLDEGAVLVGGLARLPLAGQRALQLRGVEVE